MILDLDAFKENQLFITDSNEVDDTKLKMKPSEFSRLIGVSKQAVSAWIKDGKIAIDDNGYLNPNAAIAQLIKNSNPSKLRSKALMPLIKKIKVLDLMVRQKDFDLKTLKEDQEFLESSIDDYLKIINSIKDRLVDECSQLEKFNSLQVINAFHLWLEKYQENLDDSLTICEFIDYALIMEKGEGCESLSKLEGISSDE